MGKPKKEPKTKTSKPKSQPNLIPEPHGIQLHAGKTFNPPMPDKTFICDLCGGVMYESHCKLLCQFCGYIRDCSDP